MINKNHHYTVAVEWTGNKGLGTENYEVYDRSHTVQVSDKPLIECSSDTPFRGDAVKYNPEDFFVSSLATCHMLWYLHLCADNNIVVHTYNDKAEGVLEVSTDKPGHFSSVTLHPEVGVAEAWMLDKANELHTDAHKKCFIANSCNFPIDIKPTSIVAGI
ncbi:MAG: OsmC family protein [Phycisphaerales bacterium]|nr:OsmC family protein [Phycisphaerales bacterium]